jgi:hypothetical protein
MFDAVNKSRKQQRGHPFRSGQSGNQRGRPRGSLNKRTRALIEAAEAGGEMPLDFLLRLMRDPSEPNAKRLEAAKAAAPFCHAKLNAVDPPPANIKEKPKVSIAVSFVDPPSRQAEDDDY